MGASFGQTGQLECGKDPFDAMRAHNQVVQKRKISFQSRNLEEHRNNWQELALEWQKHVRTKRVNQEADFIDSGEIMSILKAVSECTADNRVIGIGGIPDVASSNHLPCCVWVGEFDEISGSPVLYLKKSESNFSSIFDAASSRKKTLAKRAENTENNASEDIERIVDTNRILALFFTEDRVYQQLKPLFSQAKNLPRTCTNRACVSLAHLKGVMK